MTARAWLALLLAAAACGGEPRDGTRRVVDLSGDGWTLTLDPAAPWADDPLHLPGVDVAALPARPPVDGWAALDDGVPVSVPGTVEGVLWDELGGDHVGVSWWSRALDVPAPAPGQRVVLCFEAVRLRAEVFLDERLAGYDAVGNTPFEVDVTDVVGGGGRHRLAVRVTDPGGNFDWRDYDAHTWGEQTIPASHGFGGVSGPVRLELRDALHVTDVFVANTPSVTGVEVSVTLGGPDAPAPGDVAPPVSVTIVADDAPGRVLHERVEEGAVVREGPLGPTVVVPVQVPSATPWTPATPALYRCRVALGDGDATTVRFGFRWFAPDGVGRDAVLRLNGRRVVLRSAISWGFWPVTGLVPTRDLAERQVRAAQALGLNMLNHHRTIAAPGLLDVHDELGLLAYGEPGGYWADGGDELCHAFAREKWLRMVRRDRNHPSLVILNMINEASDPPEGRYERDLLDAQRLDPTRVITYTSAWADTDDASLGLHARPGEPGLHVDGWWDHHNAPGPGVDRDVHWNGPDDYLRRSDHREEVVFWGEDGAIATQPRLARIAEDVAAGPRGWDGTAYLGWKAAYERYLAEKGWEEDFPDLDALTMSTGDVALTYQATAISNIRIGDVADGYVVNGWDGSRFENHSGIVDAWRRPKGHAEVLAAANAPLLLAVKLRTRVTHVGKDHGGGVVSPAVVEADIGLVNEVGVAGAHELVLTVLDPDGDAQRTTSRPVRVTGGDVYGEVLLEDLRVLVDGGPGRYRVRAELFPAGDAPDGDAPARLEPVVAGEAELVLVDWRGRPVPDGGALLSGDGRLAYFLNTSRQAGVPVFTDDLPPLRWVVADFVDPEPTQLVPTEALLAEDGAPGLTGRYHDGAAFEELVTTRTDGTVDFLWGDGGPHEDLGGTWFSVRWTGRLVPPESGPYRFHTESSGGVRLKVAGEAILEEWTEHGPQRDASEAVTLEAGVPVDVELEFFQEDDNARVRLLWTTPAAGARGRELVRELGRRVAEDGTTWLVLDHTDAWTRLLDDAGLVRSDGILPMGRYWLGGSHFVRDHPLFAGLPTGGALSWEYQELVHYGMPGYGLLLHDEEAVAACITGHTPRLATTVGVVRRGSGRIVLSTLDIPKALPGPAGPHDVPKALLQSFLEYAVAR